jgi:hypothetical protein
MLIYVINKNIKLEWKLMCIKTQNIIHYNSLMINFFTNPFMVIQLSFSSYLGIEKIFYFFHSKITWLPLK